MLKWLVEEKEELTLSEKEEIEEEKRLEKELEREKKNLKKHQ